MRGDCVYNRYIPGTDGTFQRMTVTTCTPPEAPEKPCAAERQSSEPCGEAGARPLRALLPKGMDTGDLLLLVIVLLLLIDGEEDDTLSILLTLAAFILM